MISDDTEHTLFVAQCLLEDPDDSAAFQRRLGWKLRLWFLGLPAGIGFATLKAILRLWVGFPAQRSGVRSAGNGPAMRSAVLGAYFADDEERRRRFVTASTRLTHIDPRAETAAQAVAEAAAWVVSGGGDLKGFLPRLKRLGEDEEWVAICAKLTFALGSNHSVREFAEALGAGDGVSGYAYRTVPVAIYAWMKHSKDFRGGLAAVLDCGGDTDTVGAILGALIGLGVGARGIPAEWTQGIWEWPRSTHLLIRVGERLAEQRGSGNALGQIRYFWPGLAGRNVVFLLSVLTHGLRRLFPPY